MQHKYNVTGKITKGKKSKVDSDLSKFENVSEVVLTKNNFSATIIIHFNADLIDLQNQIGGKYSEYQIETTVLVA